MSFERFGYFAQQSQIGWFEGKETAVPRMGEEGKHLGSGGSGGVAALDRELSERLRNEL